MPPVTARVSRIRDLTHDVRELELTYRTPETMDFVAGQFVTFKVRKPDGSGTVNRAYSIASPPSRRTSLDLVFNLVPGGPGSTYLYHLNVGDAVTFTGPSGHFVLKDDPPTDLLFVATGTGVAPFRAMALAELERSRQRRITLVWGLRHERDVYYQEEFAALSQAHPRFTALTTLSRPSPEWKGERGRVQRLIEERIRTVANLEVYLCGNSAMIHDVTVLLRGMGDVPIYKEQYYLDTVRAGASA